MNLVPLVDEHVDLYDIGMLMSVMMLDSHYFCCCIQNGKKDPEVLRFCHS